MISDATYQTEDVLVFDNVLESTDFKRLFSHLNSANYFSVHRQSWQKVWRLHDGDPLTSEAGWFYPTVTDQRPSKCFPESTPIDTLVSWIVKRSSDVEEIVGRSERDWKRLSYAPWIYPPGAGLSLHSDGHTYTGAFTFFAHPEWRLHWGGHLLVLDPRTHRKAIDEHSFQPAFLGDEEETERVLEPGVALAVFPKPNRIVFLSARTQHLITRVDVNAGQCPRVSVAGFFHKTLE